MNKRNILFLAAEPVDEVRLRLGKEFSEIETSVRGGSQRDALELLLPNMALRSRDILRLLTERRPNVVHFSGHGTDTGSLCFEDEQGNALVVLPQALADMFRFYADHVECVILNACYSEAQAIAIHEHIPYVVGMNKSISDEAAIAFSIGFYQELAASNSIERACDIGRIAAGLVSASEYNTPIIHKRGTPTPT